MKMSTSTFTTLKRSGGIYTSFCTHCRRKLDSTTGLKREGHSSLSSGWHQASISTSAQCGPLRRGKTDYYKEEKLPVFDYGKIHPEKKRLYVFGRTIHGATGLDRLVKPQKVYDKQMLFIHRPVRHAFGDTHAITDIAAGHGFSLIAVKPKHQSGPMIFGCGYNTKSQLGFQPNEREKPLGVLISIVPIPLPIDKSSRVLALGAGRGHSIVSVEGKGLLAFGENTFGQCGRKVIEDEQYLGSKYVCRIERFGPSQDYDVIQIASRFDVSVCLTRMGSVYTFGSNREGQLGRGKQVDKPWLSGQVGGDLKGEKVMKVSTSGASVLAVSEKGQLFGWGCNDCGQIKPSEANMHYEPIHIKLPRRIGKVIDVAMGNMFTFVLNEFGNVYVWGHGASLGLGPKTLVVKEPTLIPPPLFGRNQFSPDVSVVKIVSSFQFAAAINSTGDMFTWGKNDEGCLGLGQLKGNYQFFPLKVAMSVPVHKVSLGVDHAVVMTKSGY